MRLRSVLRNGGGGSGRGRARSSALANAFFTAQGLFSLDAHAAVRQSASAVTPQLESRMRETRPSGSEGGGAKPIVSPYPYVSASPS